MRLCGIGTTNRLHKTCTVQSEPGSHLGGFRGLPGMYNFTGYDCIYPTNCLNFLTPKMKKTFVGLFLVCNHVIRCHVD